MRWWIACALASCGESPSESPSKSAPTEPVSQSHAGDAQVASPDTTARAAIDASHDDAEPAAAVVATDVSRRPTDAKPAIDDRYVAVLSSGSPCEGTGEILGQPVKPRGRVFLVSERALDETSLEAETVRQRLWVAYRTSIRRCYGEHLVSHPDTQGQVTLEMTIDPDGRVEKRKATTTISKDLARCLECAMDRWRFATPYAKNDGPATRARFELVLRLEM